MPHAAISLSAPPTAKIQEVVLRGTQSLGERYLRERAVNYLRRQVGCSRIWLRPQAPAPDVFVSLADWQNPAANALNFDRLLNSVGRQGHFRLVLSSRDWLANTQAALEFLNRYQRLLSHGRELAPSDLPAASDEAVDVWRWVLRLRPGASISIQRAALRGDEVALSHAQSTDGLLLLRDAADISFFSMRSWQYLRTWGVEQTQATVERRLGRMSDEAICHALATRQPSEISDMIEACFNVWQPASEVQPSLAVAHAV